MFKIPNKLGLGLILLGNIDGQRDQEIKFAIDQVKVLFFNENEWDYYEY